MSDQCASCGKAAANLKACKACKLVKYCGVECQVAHRPAHKKACKKKAKELFDEKLYALPPKKEECPICMIPLPCKVDESSYMSCCGKIICNGCRYCLTRNCCPFCNTARPKSDEENMKRLLERIEKYSDPEAMVLLASCYHGNRLNGLPVDQSKAFELLQRACELGSAAAHYNLGIKYQTGDGTEIDMKKAVRHWQIAAMRGSMFARHNIGNAELLENGNYHCAMKHFMIAAKIGNNFSLDAVKLGFRNGHVTKEELETTLRGYQAACDETRSEQRDKAVAIKKARG
eukprot:scaffold10584_cov23-Cyclotella_meneghiniana.AAC.2